MANEKPAGCLDVQLSDAYKWLVALGLDGSNNTDDLDLRLQNLFFKAVVSIFL